MRRAEGGWVDGWGMEGQGGLDVPPLNPTYELCAFTNNCLLCAKAKLDEKH